MTVDKTIGSIEETKEFPGGTLMKKSLSESKILKILLLSFVLTAAISFGLIQIIASSAPTPGSNQDPLVTKSYVDMKITQALENITASSTATASTGDSTNISNDSDLNDRLIELENRLKVFEQDYNYTSSAMSGQIEKTKFNVIQLYKGQKMLTGEGTEFILRAGIANAISGPGGDLSNLTTGLNVENNSKLNINHLIISSRDDGRGLVVISDTVWVLVKGIYKVGK